jgi:hypothetical protein
LCSRDRGHLRGCDRRREQYLDLHHFLAVTQARPALSALQTKQLLS